MRSRLPIRLLTSALALAALGAAAAYVHDDAGSASPPRASHSPLSATACASSTPPPTSTVSSAPSAAAASRAPSPSPSASSAGRAAVGAELRDLRLVSYYPSTAAWTNMWTDWQPSRIGHDLCAIAALGANAVRIIVQPQIIGYPTPAARMLERLETVMDLASARGLRVQLTLFDWWSDYTDHPRSDAWVRALLSGFRDDPRIAFCELKNEINPYDTNAMAWARHELPVLRATLGSIPVTISVGGNSPVSSLTQLKSELNGLRPDFYDMHYYGRAGAAFAFFSRARSAVAPVPLFIGETGDSSGAAGSPAGDAAQDLYLRTVEWAARRAELPYAAPWMYTDLVPSAVPTLPVPIAPYERYFGLVRTDGTAKPAARSLRDVFAGRPISTAFGNLFDSGHDGVPDCWQATDPAGGSLAWDSAVGHTAPGSARMSGTAADTPSDLIPAFYTTPVAQPVRAGETFRLAAWARGLNSTGTNRVAISWYAEDGGFVKESDSPALPGGSTTWTELTVTARTPRGAAYAQARLQSEGDSGTVWFDDVSFVPVT